MQIKIRLATVIASMLLGWADAHALPVGFKDSWMNMGEFSRDFRELDIVYTFTRRDAIGLDGFEWRFSPRGNPQGQQRLSATGLHYSRLVARWNAENSQTNIYALIGLGRAQSNFFSGSKHLLMPGFEADYETRRVYVAARLHGYRGDVFKATRWGASAGVSFYETEYDEWQPWVILDLARQTGDATGKEITPSFRLIHKTVFLEFGLPFSRGKSQGLKMNFRYTH